MNKLCILLIIIFISQKSKAQFGGEQIISTDTEGAWTVYAGDLDGDGLIDVASANRFSDDITWFKNLGNGQFGPLNLIAGLDQPLDVNGADIDGDGDIDVIATTPSLDLTVWYENLDGLGTFSAQQIISNQTLIVNDVQAGDIDNDGDIDLVTGSDASGVAWHENIDGLGSFAPMEVINSSIPNARAISLVDIDGDTDLDVVATSSGSFTLSWYENLDGLGNFGPIQILSGNALTKTAVFAADLNNNNIIDLVVATFAENKIEWFENLGGSGNFASPQIITTEAEGAISVFVADLDNDGDMDVLSGSLQDDKVAWYQNLDGLGSFGSQQVISIDSESPFSVQAADLDNDGDMDALSASRNDNKVAWYENFTVLSLADTKLSKVVVYPNPTKDTLFIESPIALTNVTLLDLSGKIVFSSNLEVLQIDVSLFSKGIYFIMLQSGKSEIMKRVVIR